MRAAWQSPVPAVHPGNIGQGRFSGSLAFSGLPRASAPVARKGKSSSEAYGGGPAPEFHGNSLFSPFGRLVRDCVAGTLGEVKGVKNQQARSYFRHLAKGRIFLIKIILISKYFFRSAPQKKGRACGPPQVPVHWEFYSFFLTASLGGGSESRRPEARRQMST